MRPSRLSPYRRGSELTAASRCEASPLSGILWGRGSSRERIEGPRPMFRISYVLGVHREHDRRTIAAIEGLFYEAFPALAADADYIPRKLAQQTTRGYPAILLAA